jgi:hypothetical protein
MTPQALLEQTEQHRALLALWNNLLPERSVDPWQFSVWLRLHPFARIVVAVEKTGRKATKLGAQMDADYAVRFCSRIANDMKSQALKAAAW